MVSSLSLRRVVGQFAAIVLIFHLSIQTASAETFTNFLGMKFVSIPGGVFNMGVAEKDHATKFDELPQHKVRVDAFQIMSTEVTLAHFKRFIVESTHIELLRNEFMEANKYGDDRPVVHVSWNDIRLFLHWLNQNKPESDASVYMLPTEAEWEYACRAGEDTLYCGSDEVANVAWYSWLNLGSQQPVAKKQANAFGLYDMSGNVREWVQDCYHDTYEDAPNDGRAWSRNCLIRSTYVARGGSWDEPKDAARATDRLAAKFNKRDETIGFRVVRKVLQW